jgi:hypothetical protein
MSEPIFARLLHDASEILHHHHGHPAATIKEGNMINLTAIHQEFTNFTAGIKSWAEDMEGKLPEMGADLGRIGGSPIVQEVLNLGDLVLPPGTEQAIAGAIRAAGAAAAALRDAQAATASPADPTQAPAA